MGNLSGFDASKVKPTSFEPLPAGWYTVVITESENKPTKAGTGSYLQLTLEVVDGEYKGRKLFERLNLENPNAQAVEIARGTLSAICHAVNVLTPRDSSELHNKPMQANVSLRRRADNGEMTNEVKGYRDTKAGSGSARGGSRNGSASSGNASGGQGRKRWQPKRVRNDDNGGEDDQRDSLPDYDLDLDNSGEE